MKKIIKKIIDVLFIILIIALIGYFVLRNMGIVEIYQVETGSMEHGIHIGDYVLICSKERYEVGDIVTYRKDQYYITHRIIKSIRGEKVITKGDANNDPDEEISMSDIVGRVIYIGGLLNIIIDYKYGIVGCLLGIYLLTCYSTKKDKKELEEKIEIEETKGEIYIKKEETARKRIKKKIRPKYRKI